MATIYDIESIIFRGFGRLIYATIPLFAVVMMTGTVLSGYKGIGLPPENELQYSTGFIKAGKIAVRHSSKGLQKAMPVIYLSPSLESPKAVTYICSYSGTMKFGDCFHDDIPTEYIHQYAKIGWYQQPDIIFLDNPYRQLVTLEVNGKMVIDYQTTKNKIQEANRSNYIANFIFMIVNLVVVYLWFKKIV